MISTKSYQVANQKDRANKQFPPERHPFWFGAMTVGRVSIPISLISACRRESSVLKMANAERTPEYRRFCGKIARALDWSDIAFGFPVDRGPFSIVEGEGLKALFQEGSREISLRRFVPMNNVNLVFFDQGYFLAPGPGAMKAYRILARSMEEAQRVGIATFVIRDREYILAIIAENGVIRAETLGVYSEVRGPADIGFPELDDQGQEVMEPKEEDINDKEEDMIRGSSAPAFGDKNRSNVVDLLKILKARIITGRQAGKIKTTVKKG